jgi:TorA maturation chaperone TorD
MKDEGGGEPTMTISATVYETTPVDVALAGGMLYSALATCFRRPTEAGLQPFRDARAAGTVVAAARLLDRDAGDDSLVEAAERLTRPAVPPADALAEHYDRLFGHTTRGVVCLFEAEFGTPAPFQQPHALADLAGFYRAFGVETGGDQPERADHMGCECEFMALLCLKEAWLRQAAAESTADARDRETLDVTCEARRRFLRDHVARVGPSLAAALESADPDGFYHRVGTLLDRLIDADCRRLGVAAGPPTLDLRPLEVDDTPMACGTGDDLIQIQGLRGGS